MQNRNAPGVRAWRYQEQQGAKPNHDFRAEFAQLSNEGNVHEHF